VKTKQKYPYWRLINESRNWAFYTRARYYAATCMYSQRYHGWFVPHLADAGPFDRIEDAKALVEEQFAAGKLT
jgi:hypothetical protein